MTAKRTALTCLTIASAIVDVALAQQQQPGDEPWPAIERRLPPAGIEIPAALRDAFEKRLAEFDERVKAAALSEQPLFADVEVFAKALRYALDHGEFYAEKEFAAGEKALDLAFERLALLEKGETPWAAQRGLLVRGYRSMIDDSIQPFGLHIPEELDLEKPAPVLIWLHGRGDKITDLHFIQRCLAKNSALGGYFDAEDVITVHPFGRQCVGWKHAGEIDVFEVLEELKKHYKIDADRVVLAGFSMGGAGAWHIGAHYADQFCAVHAGAGFAETARYNKLTPELYPVDYEQTLWRLYDVPNYTRNLFNVPTIAYSGEEDKQKQAADLMAEAFVAEGRELPHLIGPGMGHKYHPEVAREVQAYLLEAMHGGRQVEPPQVWLQTPTLRYPNQHWVIVTGLAEHWRNSSVQASMVSDELVVIETSNVESLWISRSLPDAGKIEIDGETVTWSGKAPIGVLLTKSKGQWELGGATVEGLHKQSSLSGPIDDAFMAPFLVVAPSGESAHPKVQRWIESELAHFQRRWKALMRGEVRIKKDSEVTAEDIERFNLILWGDPASNSLLGEVLGGLPIEWTAETLNMGGESYPAADTVPALIFPNPKNPARYVVLNSGLTFREDHDRTNSLQNPKLPDWAIIGLNRPPDGSAPGEVLAADFFDEQWRVK